VVVLGETMMTTITFTMNTTVATTIVGARDGDTVIARVEAEAGPGAEAAVAEAEEAAEAAVAAEAAAAEAAAAAGGDRTGDPLISKPKQPPDSTAAKYPSGTRGPW
jgi:hypothetical protein